MKLPSDGAAQQLFTRIRGFIARQKGKQRIVTKGGFILLSGSSIIVSPPATSAQLHDTVEARNQDVTTSRLREER